MAAVEDAQAAKLAALASRRQPSTSSGKARKRRTALVAKVASTGIATSGFLGTVAVLATRDAAQVKTSTGDSSPATTILTETIHRVTYVDAFGNPVAPPTSPVVAPATVATSPVQAGHVAPGVAPSAPTAVAPPVTVGGGAVGVTTSSAPIIAPPPPVPGVTPTTTARTTPRKPSATTSPAPVATTAPAAPVTTHAPVVTAAPATTQAKPPPPVTAAPTTAAPKPPACQGSKCP